MKTYSELTTIPTFKERYGYLLIGQGVGDETFGHNRYLNQSFYQSREWKLFRRDIIIRDRGCEMGLADYEINGLIIVHHINPILPEEVLHNMMSLMDPENVVCVSSKLHQAIHYGDLEISEPTIQIRTQGDTLLW